MARNDCRTWLKPLVGLPALLALLLIAVTFGGTSAVRAQDATPAGGAVDDAGEFEIIRTAISQKFKVNLKPVKSYNWEVVVFPNGIESCVDDANKKGYTDGAGRDYTVVALDGRTFEARIDFNDTHPVVCDHVTGPEAAPAANGDNPAPVAGGAKLNGFALGGQVFQFNPNTISVMQRSGMTWAKQQVAYNLGDDPGTAAGTINTAHAAGFKVLVSIKGNKDQIGGDYAGYINNFANYAGGVAALGADAIEVWNEANIDREWPAGSINGATYTQMLAATYNAIKSRNPNTTVISGAPAPTGYFGAAGCGSGGCNDDVFMQQMAQAGAAQYLDCVGLHYNEGIIPPTQNSGDPRGSYPSYYFSSMLQRGYGPFGGKPVCFTELGYLSGQGFDLPIPANFAWANNTTVANQAAWLAGAATAAAQSGKVRLMIVWNVDFPFYTATDPMGGYGIFRPDKSCPACDALGAVMK